MASILTQTFDDDEDSETEFNPGAEQGSDDEQDTKPATTNGRSSASPARRRSPKAEDSDDEKLADDNGEDDEGEGEDLDGDDDDEEEEDEEDEGIRSRPRKRRRGGLGAFFEEEAEVDEDDDDVEGDEEGLGPEFIEETHPDDDLPVEADQDDRRHRELDRKRQLEASMDAEKQAAEFRERYGRRTATSMGAKNYMPQNLLMPDVSDPSIFAVKCREGKEKEIVQSINRKFFQRQTGRDPMKIFSAFERGEGAMKGYIFVEARNKADVENGLNGVHDVYPHSKMNLVPMKEMPDLLRVMKSKELEPGAYVRIRKGLYTGDLAVVEDAVPNGLDVLVKLVPRLTYGLDEDQNHSATPDAKRKRPGFGNPAQNLANRPPARLFNESQAKQRHARFLQQFGGLTRKEFQYRGDKYEDGFLIKNFKINQLTTENVQPKLEETQLFTSTGQDGAETLDLETLKRSLHDKSTAESSYQVGDEVEVFSGEQKGAIGRTERVTGNIVSIRVSEGELKDQLVEVPVRSLRKIFNEGDNVVVGGASKYRDQVGTVVAIENDKVTILSHDNQMEFTVFSKDLRIASGAGASTERSPFEVRDLVHLTATTFGCVVSADPQTVKVMDQNGSIETRLPSALSKVMQSRNVVAVDKNGSEIRPGDMVKEVGGEGKSGSILHIYRNFIYAHDRTRMIENAGIWVARSSNVIGRSSRNGAGLTDLSKMNPALAGKAPNGAPMAPPQRPGIDRLIRKKVKITKGPYKGHRGTVKDTTISEARVELESKNKTVNIDKGQLSVIDLNTDQTTPYHEWARGQRGTGGAPPRMQAGQGFPSSRVPDGARTPAAAFDGGRTPAWGASSARTPAWGGPSSMADSSRGNTTYGGAGNYNTSSSSRTPAWSAKTPYGGDHGFSSSSGNRDFDAFAAGAGGSRTPAYSGATTSRTPAWGGPSAAASAPTPAARAYDAPTPAMNAPTPGAFEEAYTPAYSAPTPGAGFNDGGHQGYHNSNNEMNAPTPHFAKAANTVPLKNNRLAVAMDAPTPAAYGASAPTPAAYGGGPVYDAPTPAVGGGPRYAEDDDEDD
ncbi:Transcription elongation factor spt5 [Cyphellophora attinorum]|uniref:Transcription elongation factor SPT5 n=1 Tax=Cyphellophora attinorum TaxID=1664694 RepID=A0A0N1H8G8_9EURO|nr:Transcription elongation factor spt5 [Phialophora attinorum]KPI39637.1 Transcription elongation factor spt5 [Phialophora attinorum]